MSRVNMLHLGMVVLTSDGKAHLVVGWCFYGPILESQAGEWINYDMEQELYYVE